MSEKLHIFTNDKIMQYYPAKLTVLIVVSVVTEVAVITILTLRTLQI